MIDFLIIQEAPVIELLPAANAEKRRSFHYDIYMKSLSEGWEAALVDFMATLIGAVPFPPDLNDRVSQNMDFFFKHEYKAFIQYIPNVKQIRVLSEMGLDEKALQELNNALEIDPKNANSYFKKGNSLTNLGKFQEAIQALDKAIELAPNEPNNYHNRFIITLMDLSLYYIFF